jgi:hypothetical protein
MRAAAGLTDPSVSPVGNSQATARGVRFYTTISAPGIGAVLALAATRRAPCIGAPRLSRETQGVTGLVATTLAPNRVLVLTA